MKVCNYGSNFVAYKDGITIHSIFYHFKDSVFPELSYTLMIVQYINGKQIYNERVKGLHTPFIEWFNAVIENV